MSALSLLVTWAVLAFAVVLPVQRPWFGTVFALLMCGTICWYEAARGSTVGLVLAASHAPFLALVPWWIADISRPPIPRHTRNRDG